MLLGLAVVFLVGTVCALILVAVDRPGLVKWLGLACLSVLLAFSALVVFGILFND